jgi:hypothetical protein
VGALDHELVISEPEGFVSRIDVLLEEDIALGPFLGSVITVKVVLLRYLAGFTIDRIKRR